MKTKFGMQALVLLLVVALAGAIFVPAVSADQGTNPISAPETPDNISESNFISQDYAKDVAILNIKKISLSVEDFSEWQDATAQSSIVFHDLDGNVNAYTFDVVDDKGTLGYIIVSATRDNYPILEFSKGDIPKAPSDPMKLADTEISKGNSISKDPEYVYLGATFYYAKYHFADKNTQSNEGMVVDLTDQCIINQQDLSGKTSPETEKWEKVQKDEASRLWISVDEDLAVTDSYALSSTRSRSGYVSGVPYYLRGTGTHGCCPTAAGMLLAFWRNHGFSNLPLGSSGYDLIDELAVEMGTDSSGNTAKINVVDGIKDVFDNHGYDSSDVSVTGDYLWVSWEECTDEIDDGRPFMLGLFHGGTPQYGTQDYGDHAVTGVGYRTISEENYVTVHDGWNPNNQDRYLAYGNWWWGTWLYKVEDV